MKIEECLVGQFVIIHKPIRRALEPVWVDDMDMFNGCLAVIIHQGPLASQERKQNGIDRLSGALLLL